MADDNKNLNINVNVNGVSEANQVMGGLVQSFSKANKEATLFGNTASNVMKGVLGANLLMKAINLTADAFKAVVTDAIDYKRQLLAIETILPRGTKVTNEMKEAIQDLSKEFGIDKAEMAKNYYTVLSAGVEDVTAAQKILKSATELATGGLANTASTIDLLSTVYNTYGESLATSGEAADSLFKAAQIGKTNIEQLSSSMGKALPLAKQFGLTFDEVGSIIATFSNRGVTTANSVTYLNALLTAIAKKGDDLGKGMNLAAVQTDGLAVVMDRLRQKTGGSADALVKLLGRQEAARAAIYLGELGIKGYNDQLDKFTDKAGLAKEASDKMISEDVGKQWDRLKQNALDTGTVFAEKLLPVLNNVLAKFLELKEISDKQRREGTVWNEETEDLVTYAEQIDFLKKKQSDLNEEITDNNFELKANKENIAAISEEIKKLQSLAGTNTGFSQAADEAKAAADKIRKEIEVLKSSKILTEIDPSQQIFNIKDLEKQAKAYDDKYKQLLTQIGKEPVVSSATATPGKTGPTDEQKKAAAKLSEERIKLERQTDSQIAADKLTFYSKLTEDQRKFTQQFSMEEKIGYDVALQNFELNSALRLQKLGEQRKLEKDIEKQKTLDKLIEFEVRMGIENKAIEDQKKKEEFAAEQLKFEQENITARMEMYATADEEQRMNRELFSEEEQLAFDQTLETMTANDARKISQMMATAELEKDEQRKLTLFKQAEVAKRIAEDNFEKDTLKKNVEQGLQVGQYAVSAGLAFAKKGTRERKNLLRAQVVMDTATAAMRAYSDLGPVLGTVAATLITIKGLGNLKQIDQQNFAGGGIFNAGGTSINGDSRSLNGGAVGINDREMILNMQQQANLFKSINSGSMNNSGFSNELLQGILIATQNRQNLVMDGVVLNTQLERLDNRILR